MTIYQAADILIYNARSEVIAAMSYTVFLVSLLVVAVGVLTAFVGQIAMPNPPYLLVAGGVIAGLGGLASAVSGIVTILGGNPYAS